MLQWIRDIKIWKAKYTESYREYEHNFCFSPTDLKRLKHQEVANVPEIFASLLRLNGQEYKNIKGGFDVIFPYFDMEFKGFLFVHAKLPYSRHADEYGENLDRTMHVFHNDIKIMTTTFTYKKLTIRSEKRKPIYTRTRSADGVMGIEIRGYHPPEVIGTRDVFEVAYKGSRVFHKEAIPYINVLHETLKWHFIKMANEVTLKDEQEKNDLLDHLEKIKC